MVKVPDSKAMLLQKSNIQILVDFSQQHIVKMGRSIQSDLKLNDISVSRIHAFLKYEKEQQKFYLQDNQSKFGSLVLMKKGIVLEENIDNC